MMCVVIKFQLVHFLYWNQFSTFSLEGFECWFRVCVFLYSIHTTIQYSRTRVDIKHKIYRHHRPMCTNTPHKSGSLGHICTNQHFGQNQTVVFSWTVVFLSVVLEPSVWVVLSWWNVVLLVYSEQSRRLEQVLRLWQEPIEKRTGVNLRLLTKNSKKKIDKKSGRKQPRANDYEATVVEPAPDAINAPCDGTCQLSKAFVM
jgi:hypothetical protein